jgi:hypothetical protein
MIRSFRVSLNSARLERYGNARATLRVSAQIASERIAAASASLCA